MKSFLKKNNSGYSIIVLVIAIIVILILSGVTISALRTSRERTEIMNFIFDLGSIEDRVHNYYMENGTLPTSSKAALDIDDVARRIGEAYSDDPEVQIKEKNNFLSQLSQYDNGNYYIIDLSQLKGLSLKESFRGYDSFKALNNEDNGFIVNEGSLKVYVEKGVKYKIVGDSEGQIYYTLNTRLTNGQENYESQDEDIIVTGNPQAWVKEAELRVVLPRQSLSQTDWDSWKFKWDFGPKTLEELKEIPDSDENKNFKYSEKLIVKSNGIYSIYAYNPENGKETIRNVSVTKIDDINPAYEFLEDGKRINIFDKETGVKEIKFKTLAEYNANVSQATSEASSGGDTHSDARTKVDYYLMDNGKGTDVLYELDGLITIYLNEKSKILAAKENEIAEYERWLDEIQEQNLTIGVEILQSEIDAKENAHNAYLEEYDRQLDELNKKYYYLYDVNGERAESRLVIYIEDYAGNAIIVGDDDFISTTVIADSFNIPLTRLFEN
ncbi:MAG: hypothetical protein IKI57_00395 [Clostridia bacterium]|nr:hypothetical protein [Clostridia bacterium]